MSKRQKEEFAKLFMDLGKLIFVSLVLGFFQITTEPIVVVFIAFSGLILSTVSFIIGLQLFKEVK